ncbi:uncharacterized protein DS421_9g276610 [Arachis hypogaea]|nr:uncharacterized protein DS421_9g276610 [Arachis hypogaea]
MKGHQWKLKEYKSTEKVLVPLGHVIVKLLILQNYLIWLHHKFRIQHTLYVILHKELVLIIFFQYMVVRVVVMDLYITSDLLKYVF